MEGVDLSAGMIRRAQRDHPSFTTRVASLTRLPYPDGSFDGYFSWYSTIHSADRDLPRIFDEACRVLRARGVVLMGFRSGHGAHDVSGAYRGRGHDVTLVRYRRTPDQIAQMLAEAGFHEVARLERRPSLPHERDGQAVLIARSREGAEPSAPSVPAGTPARAGGAWPGSFCHRAPLFSNTRSKEESMGQLGQRAQLDENPAGRVGGPPSPAGRPLEELAREITAGAVRLAAATAAWLRLVAEFDERGGWHEVGIASCAHWLAWQCGLSPGAAREHVRVARALRRLPGIDRAFAAGRLSFAKVRALTRVADADCEADLLEVALELTASQLERVVRQWRRADRPDEQLLAARERFETWWDDDGMLVLRVRMRPEQGAGVLAAVDSLAERFARRERAERKRAAGTGGKPAAPEPEPVCGGDEEVALARERTTARRLAALARLADAAAEDAAAGRAYLEGGPALHPAQARRMLCEATVVSMLEKDREVLAVGRAKRRATRAQRRALLRRDGGCARPGCPEHRIERLHAHHLRHWLHGGRTDVANLVLLCDADHGLAHDLDLVMTRRGRELVVATPDGRRVWGRADHAFTTGLAGLPHPAGPTGDPAEGARAARASLVGVEPIDQETGRHPAPVEPAAAPASPPEAEPRQLTRRTGPASTVRRRPPARPDAAPRPARRSGPAWRRAVSGGRSIRRLVAAAPPIGATLFPTGEPPLPDAMKVNGERMDTAYVVGVLMGNRDLARRLAAESGAQVNS